VNSQGGGGWTTLRTSKARPAPELAARPRVRRVPPLLCRRHTRRRRGQDAAPDALTPTRPTRRPSCSAPRSNTLAHATTRACPRGCALPRSAVPRRPSATPALPRPLRLHFRLHIHLRPRPRPPQPRAGDLKFSEHDEHADSEMHDDHATAALPDEHAPPLHMTRCRSAPHTTRPCLSLRAAHPHKSTRAFYLWSRRWRKPRPLSRRGSTHTRRCKTSGSRACVPSSLHARTQAANSRPNTSYAKRSSTSYRAASRP
jgi:hypothetical protein